MHEIIRTLASQLTGFEIVAVMVDDYGNNFSENDQFIDMAITTDLGKVHLEIDTFISDPESDCRLFINQLDHLAITFDYPHGVPTQGVPSV